MFFRSNLRRRRWLPPLAQLGTSKVNSFRAILAIGGLYHKTSVYSSLVIWRTSSSTGVSRSKKETRTRTLVRSSSTLSIEPMKSANGPLVILTTSPMENEL